MRIVTLNTWKNEGDYPRRLRLMCEGLSALNPDVVCLQECFIGGGHDTTRTISDHLRLAPHAAPARRKPRGHGDQFVDSTSGLAILAREGGRSEVLELPADPDDGQRIAQRLDLVAHERSLRILNLHLTHLRGARGAGLRATQMETALEWAKADLRGALVVAGDLNAEAGDPALARLKPPSAPTTLQAALAGTPDPSGPAIDHCHLWRHDGWRVGKLAHAMDHLDEDGWRPSDHKAVVLDILPV